MRLLLDTHAFLWFITADSRLSSSAEQAMRDSANDLLLSVVSVWEIGIKVSIGRLPVPLPLDPFIPDQIAHNRTQLLPLELAHTLAVSMLPLHHRDPFDRMLITQAQQEGLAMIRADPWFDAYGVQRIW